MNKPIIILLLILFISSCTDIKQSEKKITEIETLRAENDSLKKIVAEINNKYVFDSIFIKTINSPNNTLKTDSDYEMQIMVVGYNPTKSYFVKFDSIANGKKVNPDTLNQRNGIFLYKTKLVDELTRVSVDVKIENKFGQNSYGTLSDLIKIKN
ncbi:hypothetical protein ACFFVB_15820 [Formosa undariae]|uniref:DUF3251 domain-containing protein n=1 Tax=Formosa undariae TaxID=1325436 RepID=A0ABV5F532_9FLAO